MIKHALRKKEKALSCHGGVTSSPRTLSDGGNQLPYHYTLSRSLLHPRRTARTLLLTTQSKWRKITATLLTLSMLNLLVWRHVMEAGKYGHTSLLIIIREGAHPPRP